MPHIDLLLANIKDRGLTRVEHAGKKFVVVRDEGKIFAYPDVCPHAFWPLSRGTLRDGVLICPGHGWEFNVRTGRCINAPDRCLTPVSVSVRDAVIRLEWEEDCEPASLVGQVITSNSAGCA